MIVPLTSLEMFRESSQIFRGLSLVDYVPVYQVRSLQLLSVSRMVFIGCAVLLCLVCLFTLLVSFISH